MKILVIRRDNIGDLVCTTPLLSALRKKHRGAWIGALVNSYNAPVLKNNADVDEVLAYTKLKHLENGQGALYALLRRFRMLWRLRHSALDLVVLATTDFSPRMLQLARLLRPGEVAGFSDGSSAAAGLDHAVPTANVARMHEVERIYALAPLLGLEATPPPLKVVPDALEVNKAAVKFGQGRRKVAVHISARRPRQRWPAEAFVALIRRLCVNDAVSVVLLWSPGASGDKKHPGDDEKAAAIMQATASLGVSAYPTRRLEELIGALAACDAVVCSDGGAMHIAAALRKPIVAFFGDSPVERWRPWGVPHRVLRASTGDVASITAEETADALFSLLHAAAP